MGQWVVDDPSQTSVERRKHPSICVTPSALPNAYLARSRMQAANVPTIIDRWHLNLSARAGPVMAATAASHGRTAANRPIWGSETPLEDMKG